MLKLTLQEDDALVLTMPDGRDCRVIVRKVTKKSRRVVMAVEAPMDVRISREMNHEKKAQESPSPLT